VREQLKALRIPIIAAETGGKRGRTVRVHVGSLEVTVREAGGKDHDLVASRAGVAA
jgi:chemotaxis protein CheD